MKLFKNIPETLLSDALKSLNEDLNRIIKNQVTLENHLITIQENQVELNKALILHNKLMNNERKNNKNN